MAMCELSCSPEFMLARVQAKNSRQLLGGGGRGGGGRTGLLTIKV